MPTVILLDTSFSMCRPVPPAPEDHLSEEEASAPFLRKDLAALAALKILDHFQATNRLEFVSLVLFSYQYEVMVGFTRDYEAIRTALLKVPDNDKTVLGHALSGVSQYCREEWGNSTPCQVVVLTDGLPGVGFQQSIRTVTGPRASQSMASQYSFLASLDIVCLTSSDDVSLQSSVHLLQKYVEMNGNGAVHIPDGKLTRQSVTSIMEGLLSARFCPYKGSLHCGKLSTPVTLAPPPQAFVPPRDCGSNNPARQEICSDISVVGFLAIVDVSSPPAFSRHLLLPSPDKDCSPAESAGGPQSCSDDEAAADEGKVPSLCVLLHGGLKKESMVALCQVAPNWYGILYSWSDNKKKSNLLLSIFEPGSEVVPWLGKLSELGPASMLPVNPYTTPDAPPAFPIKSGEKRSYNQACVVWVRPGGLQSDVQKILRHARKLPEKTHSFYKELNRVRRAALQYGFPDLLRGVCSVLEREIFTLPGNAPPEVAMQLQHACNALKSAADAAMDQCSTDNKHHANIVQLKTTLTLGD